MSYLDISLINLPFCQPSFANGAKMLYTRKLRFFLRLSFDDLMLKYLSFVLFISSTRVSVRYVTL